MSIIPLFARHARTWTDPDPTPPRGIRRPDPVINGIIDMAAHRAVGAVAQLTTPPFQTAQRRSAAAADRAARPKQPCS